MSRQIIPADELRRRLNTLDALRLARPLTADERDEADRLTHRLYMREYRKGAAYFDGQRRRRARMTAARYG